MKLGLHHTYARELDGAYVVSPPGGFPDPELVTYDAELAQALGLPELSRPVAARLFSGSELAEDSEPLALAYAGHQFGGFSPQLGDGRAVLLGEVVDPAGHRWDLQLKGSGPTVFSRGGDGLAPLGPVLREHLVSHGMFHLGIPTTRALATVRTGSAVHRRAGPEPGAVLARVASSHLRVGTFQFFAARRDEAMVSRLVDYSLARHHPVGLGADNRALALFDEVVSRQATLIASWMNVGFVHGVMNTDNTTISGETLDYGPCAFLDAYDPAAVFSSIDHGGRYAFQNQPAIAQWNLARLGEALLPAIDPDPDRAVEAVQLGLQRFATSFTEARLTGLREKLGLVGAEESDADLVEDVLVWMHQEGRDHTSTFRKLASDLREGKGLVDETTWADRWLARLDDPAAAADRMDAVNPAYIPRNHLVEEAIEAAVGGDLWLVERLLEVLRRPYELQPGAERYAEPAPAEFGPYQTFCGT